MSNVSYDLDTSGGLMPLIRALIKPPEDDSNGGSKSKKPQHPYYKRPGKGHNHDSCDACGEGGDLICCDRCPASFHLPCHDPPLEEQDIPAGQWLCKECRCSDADKPPSSRSSRAQSPVDVRPEIEKRTRSFRNTRTSSKKKSKDEPEKEPDPPEKKAVEKKLSSMEVLLKAARVMNPKQFELPRDMRIPCLFPGTEKDDANNGNGNSVVTVDAWGLVPLPAKHCFVCQATCKVAPLLQCDYCPLLYHQDCLDPPLTALPTGRWMCPNHVEQYIDWKLVNSISASDRVALWDKYSGPVDQHAVKIDFIRRARTARPAFRVKVPVGVRGRVVVPDMVKYHYENPPPLLPSRREYVRCKKVLKQLQLSGEYNESDEDTAKKHLICMNLSCPKYTGEGACPHEPAPHSNSESKSVDSMTDSSEDSDIDDKLSYPIKRRKLSHMEVDDRNTSKRKSDGKPEQRLELRDEDSDTEELLALAEEQLDKLDEKLVKLLAWQRLQQVLVGERAHGLWRRAPLSRRAEEAVLRSVDRARLSRYGFRHVALPSELLSRADQERIARAVWGPPPPAPCAPPAPARASPRDPDVAVRAALVPVQRPARGGLGDGLARPVPMRLSRLTVGTDSGCDLVLAHYGDCRYVSRHHALIFYDDVTHHFEVINYSGWGTRVNGALYACDVARADPPAADLEAESRAAAVRDIARRQEHPHRLNGDLTRRPLWEPACECSCPPARERSAAGAWEGSALLEHGALLQFGCLMFVFSIIDTEVDNL